MVDTVTEGRAFRHLTRVQRMITGFLLISFATLLGYGIVSADPNESVLNTFLPIITGWVGAVIGFFFSKEIGQAINNKIHTIKDTVNEQAGALQEMENKINNRDTIITALTDAYDQLEKDKQSLSHALQKKPNKP